MAIKYSPEFILFLRDSPLCSKPENLPPAEEWMGPPPEQQPRAQQQTRNAHNAAFGAFEKPRHGDNSLHDQTSRRAPLDRHVSRNSGTNHDDIVFGPQRVSFSSSGRGGNKTLDNDKPLRDGEAQGRFNNLRNRGGEIDGERFRESRNANPLRRRDTNDQDGEGWSTVKPRKSFGAEGAERFHGRMGGGFRDDKRTSRDRDDRLGRAFDTFTRDRDGDEEGRPRNNGLNKGRPDGDGRIPEKRERIDRAKNWRERDPEAADMAEDHGNARSNDSRRWGREQRAEREPEWLDEPVEPKVEARTQQDFQKWMEEMKKSRAGQTAASKPGDAPAPEPAGDATTPSTMRSAPSVEPGPDKFFMAFGTSSKDITTAGEQSEPTRPKPAGKSSSRFTSFFQSQDGGKTEPQVPLAAVPPNGMAALAGAQAPQPAAGSQPADNEEKQAFQQLLAKLQKQTMSATPPGSSPFAAPAQNPAEAPQKATFSPFEQMQGGERGDGPIGRPPPQHVQEILAPRPQQQSARPEQLLQDLVGHHQRVSSQGSTGGEANSRNNSNTEFLMNLMRAAPDSQRSDSAMMRAAQRAQKQGLVSQPSEQEAEFAQESRNPPREMRPPPPPGFPMDEGFRGSETDFRQSQPTQILQRPPPPPGLEQMAPGWMSGGQMPPPHPQQQQQSQQSQQPQPQRGPMLPPPGLAGGPGRNAPLPPHMFPPNMPPMPHPEAMGNMPPRNMGPPPPGFFNGPPQGFVPPGMAGFNAPPGPESPFAGPFEGRGMPPSGGGRGANFGRG